MYYPYQIISTDPAVPPAPILRVTLFHPAQDNDRLCELEAFLDTGADATLIPLEAVSILRLMLLDERVPVRGVGGAITKGFLCQAGIQLGGLRMPLMEILACGATVVGGRDQMLIGRDVLNLCCVTFDGRQQRFSFEAG